jgi:hypothetical protein
MILGNLFVPDFTNLSASGVPFPIIGQRILLFIHISMMEMPGAAEKRRVG